MDNFLKENWFKVGILIAILIIAYSFYHTLVVRPAIQIERKDAEQAKEEMAKEQARLDEETKKEQSKLDLDNCIADASEQYSNNWFGECKARGLASQWCIENNSLDFKSYLSKQKITEKEYREQRGITGDNIFSALSDYFKRKEDCSCSLPLYIADRLNDGLKEDKDRCYKLYPQN